MSDGKKIGGYIGIFILVGVVGLPFFVGEHMTTGGIIAFSFIEACLLGLTLIWFCSYKKWISDPVIRQTWSVFMNSILYMMVIVLFSLQSEKSHYWLIPYGLFMLLLLIAFLYIPWRGTSKGTFWEWLRQFWNPDKAFGGKAFSDFANAVGVLSAIAIGVRDAGEGWFWLGQFGAFLAALVGLSLVERWTRDPSEWFLWSAGLNFSVAAFTFLSIASPIEGNLWLKIPQTVVLGLMLGIIAFHLLRWFVKLRQFTPDGYAFFFIWILILAVGAITLLWVFWIFPTPDKLPFVFSIAAIISWIVIEGFSPFQKENYSLQSDWIKMLKLLNLGRSVVIIFGNLMLLTLVFWVETQNTSPEPLFYIGISITLLATVVGILMAAWTVALRHASLSRIGRTEEP